MQDRHALLICILIGCLFFGDALIGNRTVIPAGFLYQNEPWQSEYPNVANEPNAQFDQLFEFYPWAQFFRLSVYSGELPLWNSYSYLGTPFLANPQTALLFPLTWVHLLLPLRYSFTVIFMLKLILILIGAYLLFRDHQLSVEASLTGSLIASLSMHTVFSLANPFTNVTVVFPWAILAVHRLSAGPSARRWLACAFCCALVVLAGQPQSIVPALSALALYAGIAGCRTPKRFFAWLLACATGILLSCVQWLPTWEYLWDSTAIIGPRIVKSGPPYPWTAFLTVLIPDFFGTIDRATFWGYPGYPDLSLYSSILAILLVPFAFWRSSERRGAFFKFTVVLLICAFGVMVGLPGFEWMLELPVTRLIGRKKVAFAFIFALASLAALGMDRLCTERVGTPRGHRRVVATVMLAILSLAAGGLWYYRNFLRELNLTGATIVLVGHSLLFLGIGIIALVRPQTVLKRPWIIPFIVLVDLAIVSYPLNARGSAESLYPSLEWTSNLTGPISRVAAVGNVFPPESSMLYRLQNVAGYDVLTPRRLFLFLREIDFGLGDVHSWFSGIDPDKVTPNTLLRRNWDKVIERYGSEVTGFMRMANSWYLALDRIDDVKLFQLLNIQYWLQAEGREPPGYIEYARRPGYTVYHNREAVRARVFYAWEFSKEDEVLARLKRADVTRTAVVERRLPEPGEVGGHRASSVKQTKWSHRHHSYELEAGQPAVFVEFDRFFPGWNAYVDGGRVPLFPADYIFRGVYVPAGRHVVELRYEPKSVYLGAISSAIGIILCGLVFLKWRRSPFPGS